MASQKEKEQWADRHAGRMQQQFEPWQKALGIDGGEYIRHLRKELLGLYDYGRSHKAKV